MLQYEINFKQSNILCNQQKQVITNFLFIVQQYKLYTKKDYTNNFLLFVMLFQLYIVLHLNEMIKTNDEQISKEFTICSRIIVNNKNC